MATDGNGEGGGGDDEDIEGLRAEIAQEMQDDDERLFDDTFGHEYDTGVVIDDQEFELFGPEEEEDKTDQEEEAEAPRRRPVPLPPTQQEIDEHECTHLPYRPWCVYCRKGRGRMDSKQQDFPRHGGPQ